MSVTTAYADTDLTGNGLQEQSFLDRSYANAGTHLLGIHTPERRATAAELVERLTGMRLLVLTTVAADGRPIGSIAEAAGYESQSAFAKAFRRRFGLTPSAWRAKAD